MKKTNLDPKLAQIGGLVDYSIYALNIHRHSSFIKRALEVASKLLGDLITPEKSLKAKRNISDDKRRNLKRKFRAERSVYPYHWDDLNKDLLEERQRDVELGDPIYVKWMSPESFRGHKYAVTTVEFKPKPLPG